ncbi:MAG: hypothetical protein JO061_15820 [Acidobacteriaceae bacterium]|nr:hypothetical protein [Acidobacteriaceae bacterium]
MLKQLQWVGARAAVSVLFGVYPLGADSQDAHPRITTVAVVDHQTDQYNDPDDRIALLHADSSGGFSEAMFNDSGSGAWNALAWPNPVSATDGISRTGSPPSLAAVADQDWGTGSIFYFAADSTTSSTPNVRVPFFAGEDSWWWYGWTVPTSTGNMAPMTAISYDGPDGMPRGSVFGVSNDSRSLRELWLYQDNWSYYDHGPCPSGATLIIGPGSSLATAQVVGPADVHVVASGSDGNIWLRSTLNNHGWNWQNLGNPGWSRARVPILVAHPSGGTTRIHVFVPAWVGGSVHLFERYADRGGSGYTWASWKDWGAAPTGEPFNLTGGVTWHPGRIMNIHMFGVTDHDSSGCHGGKLLLFYWDGSGWHWSYPEVVPSGFDCEAAQTMSVAAIDSAMTRASVYLEDVSGAIWEYASTDGFAWEWHLLQ